MMRQTASSINSCLQGLYSRNLEFRQSRLIVGPMASDQNIFPTSMLVYLSGCFSTKQSLNWHIESIHEGKKPFICHVCAAAFAQKGTLNGHIESIHEGKKPLKL